MALSCPRSRGVCDPADRGSWLAVLFTWLLDSGIPRGRRAGGRRALRPASRRDGPSLGIKQICSDAAACACMCVRVRGLHLAWGGRGIGLVTPTVC